MVGRVLKFFVKETGNKERSDTVIDLLCFLIENTEMEQLFPHAGYFLGWVELSGKEKIEKSISTIVGAPQVYSSGKTVWKYDDLSIHLFMAGISGGKEILKIEVQH